MNLVTPQKYDVTAMRALADYGRKMAAELYDGFEVMARTGYHELGTAHQLGFAISTVHYGLDPHALPQYDLLPTTPTTTVADATLQASIGPPTTEVSDAVVQHHQITTSEPEAVSSGITTDDDPRLWNAKKMSANMSTFFQEASMIGKSLSETIVDKGTQGRDEIVAKLENPLEGLQGHEAQPDMGVEVEMEMEMEPEPEPEPEMD